ncbi:hypothetical protein EJ06DRAFT_144773 [Trichodelitschia bisporula]|uniref:Uncharacterized protein n=1 Tax=Trichodelitschia bisporula TaxID=703511 RepID=A0A6G1HN99_9PEZI|nr:hypothetical protein EJ06DRAFT_144773 [Trichodelitschia bisporula]
MANECATVTKSQTDSKRKKTQAPSKALFPHPPVLLPSERRKKPERYRRERGGRGRQLVTRQRQAESIMREERHRGCASKSRSLLRFALCPLPFQKTSTSVLAFFCFFFPSVVWTELSLCMLGCQSLACHLLALSCCCWCSESCCVVLPSRAHSHSRTQSARSPERASQSPQAPAVLRCPVSHLLPSSSSSTLSPSLLFSPSPSFRPPHIHLPPPLSAGGNETVLRCLLSPLPLLDSSCSSCKYATPPSLLNKPSSPSTPHTPPPPTHSPSPPNNPTLSKPPSSTNPTTSSIVTLLPRTIFFVPSKPTGAAFC